jgi:hypothetical protein
MKEEEGKEGERKKRVGKPETEVVLFGSLLASRSCFCAW